MHDRVYMCRITFYEERGPGEKPAASVRAQTLAEVASPPRVLYATYMRETGERDRRLENISFSHRYLFVAAEPRAKRKLSFRRTHLRSRAR